MKLFKKAHFKWVAAIIGLCTQTFLFAQKGMPEDKNQMVRLAKIKVDPVQLANYNTALTEQMTSAVSLEPGVLTYYAVADKSDPSSITILEIYADTNAYKSHITTPHFKKYKETVKDMVKSLELIDVALIASAVKPGIVSGSSTILNGQTDQKAHPANPFSLVYEGAITENVKGKVNIHPVTYKIKDIAIAANVYTPANFDETKKYPAIVVAHPNGGVKEQVAGLYAQHLAEMGYIAITADAAYQGGSGGTPRYVDKPANRIEDIYAMGDFIAQYKGVDTAKVGLLGICGGGGYSLKAAQADKRFKAVATLSMFNSGVVRRNGFMNSQVSTIQERLDNASKARAQEAAGGEIQYVNGSTTPLTDEQIAKLPFDLYREGYIYYNKTHAHPNSSGKYTMSSLLDLMTFDASTNMDLINQPLLMIAGSKADTYYMTDEAFGKATKAKSKEMFLINGATHIETYWKPEYVAQAVAKLVNFYQINL